MKKQAHVVVLGGGNGTSRLLTSLLPLLHNESIASLHALVHMADDGGSTGRLRDQYAVGAVGDLTKCLMALSGLRGDIRGEEFLKALEYRFLNGDFKGHTLRNAFLAALELTSDLDAAIATMARVLQVPKYAGVIPATLKPLTQQVRVKQDGSWVVAGEGEHFIAHNVDLQAAGKLKPEDVRVTFKEEHAEFNERAAEVLHAATHVVIAPGHTYGSILPTLASLQLDPKIAECTGKAIVVMTLLTTPRQTEGWSGEDFVRVYESYLGRPVKTVIANTGSVPTDLTEGQDWVRFTENEHAYELMKSDIVRAENAPQQTSDTVPRAVVVHDSMAMTQLFETILHDVK